MRIAKQALIALVATLSIPSDLTAQTRRPVEYRGLAARTSFNTATPDKRVSVIALTFYNPNPGPADVKNVRCEFRNGGTLVKQFSVARITAQPGESQFEVPDRVDGSFDKALCTPGR